MVTMRRDRLIGIGRLKRENEELRDALDNLAWNTQDLLEHLGDIYDRFEDEADRAREAVNHANRLI